MLADLWRRWFNWHEGSRAAVCIGIFVLAMMSVVTFRALNEADRNADTLKAYQVQSCERGNVFRAFVIVDAGLAAGHPVQRQQGALRVLALVDCQTGKPLPPAEVERLLDEMARTVGVRSWQAR